MPAYQVRRESWPARLNGDAHHSLEVEVSYACDRRGFSTKKLTHLNKSMLMFIDLDDCRPRMPRIWDVSLRQPIILYVERNTALRHFMNDMFDLAGWHVHRAFDTCSALSQLQSTQRFSVLLTGDELPPIDSKHGRSGLELVKAVRELPHRKELPILFFSIEDCAQEAKAAGANEFLRKPHDLFQMVDTIRKLLEVK
jgi:CheY-like chemotaxis protein